MNFTKVVRKFIVVAALALAPAASYAGIFISVGFAPPELPVYVQPVCPGDGYLWNPGYWAYGDDGYYWVPGVWVQPPTVGYLWTPGYWGWGGGAYIFHEGYWGPHVGFYGGINYGFGFGGVGFEGGEWRGGHFAYNTSVTNVNTTVIHNTYVKNVTVNNTTINNTHTSFNGGTGGIQARPTPQEAQAEHETHIPPTSVQQSHVQAARAIPANFAKANGGHPAMAAIQKPGAMNTAVPARGATPMNARAANQPANTNRSGNPVSPQGNQRPNSASQPTRNGGFGQTAQRPGQQTQARPQVQQPRPQVQEARPQAQQARPEVQQPRPQVQVQQPRPQVQQARPQAQPRPQPAPARPEPAPHSEKSPHR